MGVEFRQWLLGKSRLPGADGAGHRPENGLAASGVLEVRHAAVLIDVDLGGGGDRILVGSKEEEIPFVDVGLMLDHPADLIPVELLGGVLLAVGHDRHDDFAGALVLWGGSQSFPKVVDGGSDRIQEGGVSGGAVVGVVQIGHLGHGNGAEDLLNAGIEQCE